jgi:hypothetical protein
MSAFVTKVTPGTTASILFHCDTPSGVTLNWSTNGNAGDVYLGGPAVTSTDFAIWLDKKASGTIFIPYGETIYAVAGNGTDKVHLGAWV